VFRGTLKVFDSTNSSKQQESAAVTSEVKFPEYRGYDELRNTANTAMMALLAGSRLASHTLALTVGSERTIAEIFPAVEHIRHFNLRTDVARQYLGTADSHLASMAITYALAIHEDFVLSVIGFANNHGVAVSPLRPKAWNMHTVLFGALAYQASGEWSECFHLLRHMRNCVVHAGGRAQPELVAHVSSMSGAAIQRWQDLNDQLPTDVVQNGAIVLIARHILSALAVIKKLGREINAGLASAISTSEWAKICVEDYMLVTSKLRNSASWRRSLIGYANFFYNPLQLSDSDLETAARQMGVWTLTTWDLTN
jgi:hypothetical protein